MTFGEKLKKLRKDSGLTIDQVAEKIGITRRAYINYEQNDVRPRNRDTYYKLADIYGCDINFLLMEDNGSIDGAKTLLMTYAGMISAVAFPPLGAVGMVLGAERILSSKSSITKQQDSESFTSNLDELFLQYKKEQKRFRAIASGVLYKKIISKGYSFTPGELNKLENNIGSCPDDYIVFSEDFIDSWWFIYYAKDMEIDNKISKMEQALSLFGRMVISPCDKKRKISIVVDDLELFQALCKLEKQNSYRGYATAVLIDSDNVEIIKECVISSYEENSTQDLLPLI